MKTKAVFVLCTVLVSLMLVSAVVSAGEDPRWGAYDDIVRQYRRKNAEGEYVPGGFQTDIYYYVFDDINGNGTKELIIGQRIPNTAANTNLLEIYSCANGKMYPLSETVSLDGEYIRALRITADKEEVWIRNGGNGSPMYQLDIISLDSNDVPVIKDTYRATDSSWGTLSNGIINLDSVEISDKMFFDTNLWKTYTDWRLC